MFSVSHGGKVPVYLASSFAFIAPRTLSINKYSLPATLSELAIVGVVYLILSLIVFWGDSAIINRVLPTIITGSVIMVIGLGLAATAVEMATKGGDNYSVAIAIYIAAIFLLATILTAIVYSGFWQLIPILVGIVVGYLVEQLDLDRCIIIIDAMGTQTAIAKQIKEAGADYILAWKRNYPSQPAIAAAVD